MSQKYVDAQICSQVCANEDLAAASQIVVFVTLTCLFVDPSQNCVKQFTVCDCTSYHESSPVGVAGCDHHVHHRHSCLQFVGSGGRVLGCGG